MKTEKENLIENTRERDEEFMRAAIEQAKLSAAEGEVPVGAVVVCDNEIIAVGRNRREGSKNALAHAEIEAIDAACRKKGGWRIFMCDLYVTLEPCHMCAGAIMNSRVRRVVYGAPDKKAGAYGSLFDLNSFPVNHRPEVVPGVLSDECAGLLTEFFRKLR